MKIATLTYQRHDNYGAMLQCYALQKKIEQMGAETDVIDYICEVSENPFGMHALKTKGIKRYITGIIGAFTRFPRMKKFKEFRTLLNMTKPVTEKNISQVGAWYDGYIVGSDNVWNADITGLDERYFLSFVADKRKRTSYAASFGSTKIRDDHNVLEKYKNYLNDFALLTCRERSGVNFINQLTGRNAEAVCDPSILLTEEEWKGLALMPREKTPYLLAYQMVPSGAFVKYVGEVARKKNLKVIYIPFPYGFTKCKMKLSIGPREWLGYFMNADYIITDSFHGCAFSVIFKKQFAVRISQLGERIENLLHILKLDNRVTVNSDDVLKLDEIDYSQVDPLLQSFREDSEKKLMDILGYFAGLQSDGIADSSQCTGCLLCKKICPQNAIDVRNDELGFIYPEIKSELCIKCHKCESICNSISEQRNNGTQKYYSAINHNSEIINKSGSGGTFHALAESFINNGGVVYGAAYQSRFGIAHEEAENITGLERIMGTKYVQSYIYDIYSAISSRLTNNIPVLFVGTPCQCAALKTYLLQIKINIEHLYICDIFCHGVFSPRIWDEYINFLEDKFNERINFVSFRDKKRGWRNKHLKIVTSKQDISDYCNNEASILRIYEQNISFREACYQCKYMNMERCGDIAIGDFWGIERVKSNIDKNTGVSAVIVNTEKGEKLFSAVSDKMNITEFKKSEIMQQVLREPTKKHSGRSAFIDLYKRGGIESILTKYGQVKGKQYLKRSIIIPVLYKLRLVGIVSKILHINGE